MKTLLFEMTPRYGHEEHYFDHVAGLRPILAQHRGLLFIHRYKSLSRPGVILSHQIWRDEASIIKWRNNKDHHKSQLAGRYRHFKDYRIRVSSTLYFNSTEGDQKLWNTEKLNSSLIDAAECFVTITRTTSLPSHVHGEVFESVSDTNSFLCLTDFSEQLAAYEHCQIVRGDNNVICVILANVSRDYSMHDRVEAPQHLRPVK